MKLEDIDRMFGSNQETYEKYEKVSSAAKDLYLAICYHVPSSHAKDELKDDLIRLLTKTYGVIAFQGEHL